MSERTIGLELGGTLCTDIENRQYYKVYAKIDGVDPSGDVQAQVDEGTDGIEILVKAFDGKLNELVSIRTFDGDSPGKMVETVETNTKRLLQMARKVISMQETIDKLEAKFEALESEELAIAD